MLSEFLTDVREPPDLNIRGVPKKLFQHPDGRETVAARSGIHGQGCRAQPLEEFLGVKVHVVLLPLSIVAVSKCPMSVASRPAA